MSVIETIIDIPAEHEKNVCGQFDGYLKKIERTLHVTIVARDGAIKLIGPELMIRRAKSVFNNLVEPVSYTHLDVYKRQANKDLAKFADQINALCDKWDR